MKTSILLSAILALAGGFLFAQLDARAAGSNGSSCPPSKQIDATDSKTADLLRGKTLVPLDPKQEAETTLLQDSSGFPLKVSSREFLAYNSQTGQLEPMLVKVECVSECKTNNTGAACLSIGCTALSDGTCTSHSCNGSGCAGGSCKRTTTAELIMD